MNRIQAVRGFNTFRCFLAICGILLAVVVTGVIVVAQPAPQILAKDAQWQQVSHAGKVWGEGVVAARDGMIYVSDITYSGVIKENNPRGTIYRYDPATGATTKYMEPSGMANGLHVDKHGDLIIAQDADFGGRAVLRRNLATGKTVLLADSYEASASTAPTTSPVTSTAESISPMPATAATNPGQACPTPSTASIPTASSPASQWTSSVPTELKCRQMANAFM